MGCHPLSKMIKKNKPRLLMDAVRDFRAALSWLGQMGVPTVRGRLQEYARFCSQLEGATTVDFQLALNSRHIFEMNQIVKIWHNAEALSELGDLPKRLKWISSGRTTHGHDADHTARNHLFELTSACYLVESGFRLLPSTDGDIAAEWNGRRFLVECKRPSSEKALPGDVRIASKQLQKRRTHGRQIGIVLVDFALLINPKNVSPVLKHPDDLMSMLDFFIAEYSRHYLLLLTPELRSRDDALVICYLWMTGWPNVQGMTWTFADKWMGLLNPNASAMAVSWAERALGNT